MNAGERVMKRVGYSAAAEWMKLLDVIGAVRGEAAQWPTGRATGYLPLMAV